jgi:bacteriocin-like protein
MNKLKNNELQEVNGGVWGGENGDGGCIPVGPKIIFKI